MSQNSLTSLGSLMASRTGTVNPANFPEEVFDLYSIPAFDSGRPELTLGHQIGSPKQIVLPGDVLLSKIVPHIRRCWIVGPSRGKRIIASGEWIVFRTSRMDSGYLRHVLMGDPFHLQFMNTIAGVGGSLLRARPTFVAQIMIPSPSISKQRQTAHILDSVDALRAKRRKAIALLDDLAQSIFLEMFGADRLGYRRVDLPTAFWFQEGPGIRNWQFTENGVKLLNVGNIEKSGELNLSKTNRHISIEEAHGRYSHFLVDAGDLVIASSGISIDNDGMLRTRGSFVDSSLLPLCMNTSTIRFKSIPNVSDLHYLRSWLNDVEFRGQITRLVTGSAQLNFGPSHLKSLKISLPKLTTQKEFAKKIKKLDSEKLLLHTHLAELDALFASLQYRAFRGELWGDPLFEVPHSTPARPPEGAPP